MKIGFIGLGKLGLPIAETIAKLGHDVVGYDVLPIETFIKLDSIDFIVNNSEIVFVAVQTPHKAEHEGITRVTTTDDFDYSFLNSVLAEIERKTQFHITIAIISTVAPGTLKYINGLPPIKKEMVNFVYNPFFIAMGTVVEDFLNPEFVLIGGKSEILKKFYQSIHQRPIIEVSIASAEIVKMAYNTFIGLKIVFANNLMEMCEIFGGNVDDVTNALKQGTDRIVSPKYLTAGMGDGGGCHPRDNIVLSHLAKTHWMSIDLGGFAMMAREAQAEWLVNKCLSYNLPVTVLGLEFKPESDTTTGSSAVLCLNLLKEKGAKFGDGGVYLIGCKHNRFSEYVFPKGSIVIDPHRYIPDQEGVKVIRLGE